MGFLKRSGEKDNLQSGGRTIRGYWLLGVIGLLVATTVAWSYLIIRT